MTFPTIIDAARALLGVCDGAATRDAQGFNGADSPFVRSLFERRWLTEKQLVALHRLLVKYRGQLAGMGIDYMTLVVPVAGPATSATGGGCHAEKVEGVPDPQRTPEVLPPVRVATQDGPVQRQKEEAPPVGSLILRPWPGLPVMDHFPPRFKPRPAQEAALERIDAAYRSGKRVVVLEMPTGGGKSIICQTVARKVRKSRGRTHFLTASKILQDQYTRDFPSPEIELIKGRSNYPCPMGGKNCAEAPCTDQNKGILPECVVGGEDSVQRRKAVALNLPPDDHLCPYWRQLQVAHDSPITLFNFSSFLFQQRIGRFGHRDLMIVDEGHNIEAQLMAYVTLTLSEKTLRIINVEIDRPISSKKELTDWLEERQVFRRISEVIGGGDSDDSDDIEEELGRAESDAARKLQGQLETFLRYLDQTEWIIETVDERWGRQIVARPLHAKDFAQDLLFRHADRILVMSATILDIEVWARNLGIPMADVEHVSTPCEFPVANRPIHLTYAGNCGFRTLDRTKPKLLQYVRAILDRHNGQRGMIHTQSNHLARFILDGIKSPRFLYQEDFGGDKKAMLEAHAAKPDSVIVAPAMHEGVDLKDDLGRFQVVLKVPYPSTADKIIRARMDADPAWYGWLTALKFVQSLGRIIRSADDWGYTYVLDAGFDGFLARNGRMIPEWVQEAFRKYAPKEVRR